MPEYIRKGLGERLVVEGLITEEQYQTALKKHWETKVILRQILIDMGFITEERLLQFMSQSLGIPFIKDLFSKITDPALKEVIPEKVCRQHIVIPLFTVEGVLFVAMADPFDVFVIDDLQMMAKTKIETVLAKRDEIIQTIDLLFKTKEDFEEIVRDTAQEAEELMIIREEIDLDSFEDNVDVEDAPIIRLVNTMITQAIRERASDIHIEPDEKSLRIRYRVDGVLREVMAPPKKLQASIISRVKIMAEMDISIKRTPQDGRFKIRSENKDFDIRISSVPTVYGEKLVLRLLDQSSINKMGLDESGFTGDIADKFKELIHRPYGIILVTGPTGSGKTTTLYLALQAINSPKMNIITIEDPVEYDLEGINQIAVNVKAGVTFAQGLRSILRQDPDVIMVGEIRDLETADIAVRAALTGHLVFSTLHTNDAPASVARLVDMGVPPYLVTSSICGILAQRLVRTICPKCKESYTATPQEIEDIKLDPQQSYVFYRGKGCADCGQTGYIGRTGIFEMMTFDKEIRTLIQNGASSDDLRAEAEKAGMKTLWADGLDKVLEGVTTVEELNRVTFIGQE